MCTAWAADDVQLGAGGKSYLVPVGAVEVHNHQPDSYIKHQTLFPSKCFRKVSKKKERKEIKVQIFVSFHCILVCEYTL